MIILLLASFFLGAVPFGLVIARLAAGVDITRAGSGNIGATNVARTLGMKFGLLTLALDLAKGLTPVLAAGWIFSGAAALDWIQAGAGLAAFLGHVFSPFLRFKGGKGVATALGVFLGVAPWAVIPALLVFILVVAVWNFVSAGSMSASLVVPLAALVLGYPPATVLLGLAVSAVVFLRHRENIGRLLRGEENKWRKTD